MKLDKGIVRVIMNAVAMPMEMEIVVLIDVIMDAKVDIVRMHRWRPLPPYRLTVLVWVEFGNVKEGINQGDVPRQPRQ